MGGYLAYTEYRDSGVEWLGEIPSHWTTCHVKRLAQVSYGVGGEIDRGLIEGINLLSLPNVTKDGTLLLDEVPLCELTESERKDVLLHKGDLLFNWRNGSSEHLGKTAYFNLDGEWTHVSFLLRLRFDLTQSDPRYFQYMLTGLRITGFFISSKAGVNNTFNLNELMNLWIINPPHEEQRSIARFLDYKTAQIDALIARKESLLEKLSEKRTALISQAVTKGLDPTSPMQDSGTDWLGEMPAHWKVLRLKFVAGGVTVGIVVTPAKYYVDEGIPCLRSLNVREGRLNNNDLVYITEESNELLKKSKINKGDLVAVRTGQPGTTAVVTQEFDAANCIDLIIIRQSERFDSDFLCYQLNSYYCKNQFGAGSGGAIQQHFNIETACNLVMLIPPIAEQQQITHYLNDQTTKIDQQKTKVEQAIDKLKEYRTALITNAVTGKIDVRDIKLPEMDSIEAA